MPDQVFIGLIKMNQAQAGAVAERSKALLEKDKINEYLKISGLPPAWVIFKIIRLIICLAFVIVD